MASQFVQDHNQNLLWRIINNTPQMIQVFQSAAPGERELWFNKIISHIYNEQIKAAKQMSLRDINKYAIDFMLKLLQKSMEQQQQFIQQPVKKPDMQTFEMRKKEYDDLVNKKQPSADFTEPVKDEAITDISAALNDYVKQRESVLPSVQQQPESQPKKQVSWAENLQEVQINIVDEPDVKALINKLIEKVDYQTSLLEALLKKPINQLEQQPSEQN